MIYNASWQGYTIETNPYATNLGGESANGYIFGPDYLAALDRFPENTPITYGLNLAYQGPDYAELIAAEAAGVLDELNRTTVYSFEIGNEPDLYLEAWDSLRTGTWDGATYTDQYLDRAGIVYRQVLEPRNMSATFFETASTASTISTTFTIDDLVSDGITASVNGTKFISSWNQHDYFYFISVSTYALTLSVLMDFDNTVTQFAYWATEIATALDTGLPYNLREMQSVGPTGQAGVSDTLGAALWQLNFFCYAATLNISTVQMHMTDNSYSAPWQPGYQNDVGPNIRPTYYAFAAMAQLIGAGNGTTQISALALSETMSNVRAYTAYTSGSLMAVVLINAIQANSTSDSIANLTVTLNLPDYAGKTLYLSYLTAAGANVESNATWNGISFEQNSVGTPVTLDSTVQTVVIDSDGVANVTVRDSQAVIAKLDSLLGSEKVADKSSGSKVSSSTKSSSISTETSTKGSSSTSAGSTASSAAKKSAASHSFPVTLTMMTVMMSASLFFALCCS